MTPPCDSTATLVKQIDLGPAVLDHFASSIGCIWHEDQSIWRSDANGYVRVTNTSNTNIMVQTTTTGALIFGNIRDQRYPDAIKPWKRARVAPELVKQVEETIAPGQTWESAPAELLHPTLMTALPKGRGLDRAALPADEHLTRTFFVVKDVNLRLTTPSGAIKVPAQLTSELTVTYVPEPEEEEPIDK